MHDGEISKRSTIGIGASESEAELEAESEALTPSINCNKQIQSAALHTFNTFCTFKKQMESF